MAAARAVRAARMWWPPRRDGRGRARPSGCVRGCDASRASRRSEGYGLHGTRCFHDYLFTVRSFVLNLRPLGVLPAARAAPTWCSEAPGTSAGPTRKQPRPLVAQLGLDQTGCRSKRGSVKVQYEPTVRQPTVTTPRAAAADQHADGLEVGPAPSAEVRTHARARALW